MNYNKIIRKSKGEACDHSPMSPNQEHNYLVMLIARNPLFVDALEKARESLKKEFQVAKGSAQLCFAAASGEASWNMVRGPEAELHVYAVAAKIELLDYLLGDGDSMPYTVDTADILSILAGEVTKCD